MFRWFCAKRKAFPPWLEDSASWIHLKSIIANGDKVGLGKVRFMLPKSKFNRITFIPLLEEPDRYSLSMFFLPKGAVLPWHNHPGQHVSLRVLAGEILLEAADSPSDQIALGKEYLLVQKTPEILTEKTQNAYLVEPVLRNIHQITAKTDALFVDLITPPYSQTRVITYFLPTTDTFQAVGESQIRLEMDMAHFSS